MGDNCYDVGCFVLSMYNTNIPFYSGLLHEYIHYLQDTCTYFGLKLRNDIYNGRDTYNCHLIKGCKMSCLASIEGRHPHLIPTVYQQQDLTFIEYGTAILGTESIKENMAYNAQRYLDESYNNGLNGYGVISKYIEKECPFLEGNYLVQFGLEDISLMSDNPSVAMVKLVEFCKNNQSVLPTISNKQDIKDLYDKLEQVLWSEGLLKYDGIEDCINGVREKLKNILKPEKCNVDEIINGIELFCKNNYEGRLKNHSIVTEQLFEYKTHSVNHNSDENDRETDVFGDVFFSVFGYPIMSCWDVDELFNPNTLQGLGFHI
ncbi:MAG: hypothetical protein II852_15605 [Bacteroidales bacterium]|nr:hypothetical protein [Bacteroidales bacterium]